MTPEQRIEEAHGLWELAAQRVCALAELPITEDVALKIKEASIDERQALVQWQAVSKEALNVAARGELA